MMWYLIRLIFSTQIHINKNEFTIGRNRLADLSCESIFISRDHCKINCSFENISIIDLKSTNGIFVNNNKIESNILFELHENDVVGIGSPAPGQDERIYVFKIERCKECVYNNPQDSTASTQDDKKRGADDTVENEIHITKKRKHSKENNSLNLTLVKNNNIDFKPAINQPSTSNVNSTENTNNLIIDLTLSDDENQNKNKVEATNKNLCISLEKKDNSVETNSEECDYINLKLNSNYGKLIPTESSELDLMSDEELKDNKNLEYFFNDKQIKKEDDDLYCSQFFDDKINKSQGDISCEADDIIFSIKKEAEDNDVIDVSDTTDSDTDSDDEEINKSWLLKLSQSADNIEEKIPTPKKIDKELSNDEAISEEEMSEKNKDETDNQEKDINIAKLSKVQVKLVDIRKNILRETITEIKKHQSKDNDSNHEILTKTSLHDNDENIQNVRDTDMLKGSNSDKSNSGDKTSDKNKLCYNDTDIQNIPDIHQDSASDKSDNNCETLKKQTLCDNDTKSQNVQNADIHKYSVSNKTEKKIQNIPDTDMRKNSTSDKAESDDNTTLDKKTINIPDMRKESVSDNTDSDYEIFKSIENKNDTLSVDENKVSPKPSTSEKSIFEFSDDSDISLPDFDILKKTGKSSKAATLQKTSDLDYDKLNDKPMKPKTSTPYVKPPIIEAPISLNQSREFKKLHLQKIKDCDQLKMKQVREEKKKEKLKENIRDKVHKVLNKSTKNDNNKNNFNMTKAYSDSASIKKQLELRHSKNDKKERKDKTNNETIKEKLKKLAEKNSTDELQKTVKHKIKPMVKVTQKSRGDALVADMIEKPSTSAQTNKKTNLQEIDLFKNVQPDIPVKNNYVIPKRSTSITIPTKTNSTVTVVNKNIENITNIFKGVIIDPLVKRDKPKKKVNFILTPKIKYFEIDIGNTLKPCIYKDIYKPKLKVNEITVINTLVQSSLQQIQNIRCPTINEIIYCISQWDPSWLLGDTEYKINKRPLLPISINYLNFQDYYNIFRPLMLNELWNVMMKEWAHRIDDSHKTKKKKMTAAITKTFPIAVNIENKLMQVDCYVLVDKNDNCKQIYPKIGDLLLIELPVIKNNELEKIALFGYVTSSIRKSFRRDDPLLSDLFLEVPKPVSVIYFNVLTQWKDGYIYKLKSINIRHITKMNSAVRQFFAVCQLPLSGLMPFILNPSPIDYRIHDASIKALTTNHPLNSSQMKAVFNTCSACLNLKPKICLIKGPPGTGKTQVIANIVLELIFGDGRHSNAAKKHIRLPKILVCAPSNAAIDNLFIKLLDMKKGHKFNMVRIGQQENIHKRVQGYSLQSLTSQNCNITSSENRDDDIKSIETKLNTLNNKFRSHNYMSEMEKRELKKKIDFYMERKSNLLKYGSQSVENLIKANDAKMAEESLLRNADVICTTLSSCFTSQMEKLSQSGELIFSCCIVDEASQCTEPDILIPLLLGIERLVLVGDPNQLPATVISMEAKKYKYDVSLFSRIESCFTKSAENPIMFLDTQYRMHPEILKWPNEFFYNNMIKSSPHLLLDYKNELYPYRVVSHSYIQSSNEENLNEARLVINVAKAILVLKPEYKIGIISPYQKQKNIYNGYIKDCNLYHNVDTNTIDGFQGQERDVIILSCVRTDGVGFLIDYKRINVALTRAKHSLFVIANFVSLENDFMWRKLKEDAESRKVMFYMPRIENDIILKNIILRK